MGEEKGCVFLSSCRSVEVGYGRLGNGRKNTQAKGKHKKRREHISGRVAYSLLLLKHLRWESRQEITVLLHRIKEPERILPDPKSCFSTG